MAEYSKFYLMNTYWPNGGKSPEHFLYKLEYYKKFLALAKKLEKKKPVIFCGDINATVADIDLARPKENAGKLGCTREERAELAKYESEFIDIWRKQNPEKSEYTWWDMKTFARDRNVGWRLDYQLATPALAALARKEEIYKLERFSDHAPLTIHYEGLI